jgi:hypothetical protein
MGASGVSFSTNRWANFNLATGTIGLKEASTTATITPLPNGWYRCSDPFTGGWYLPRSTLSPISASIAAVYVGTGRVMYRNGAHRLETLDQTSMCQPSRWR